MPTRRTIFIALAVLGVLIVGIALLTTLWPDHTTEVAAGIGVAGLTAGLAGAEVLRRNDRARAHLDAARRHLDATQPTTEDSDTLHDRVEALSPEEAAKLGEDLLKPRRG